MGGERCLEPLPGVRSRGRIFLNGQAEAILCVTHKTSDYAAQIEASFPQDFPRRFMLMASEHEPPRPCRVLWRIGNKLGVVFTTA